MPSQINLVAVLWEEVNFGGRKRTLVVDWDVLDTARFNDTACSLAIHPGPNFQAGATVSVFADPNFAGKELLVGPGLYPDLNQLEIARQISSVRFSRNDPRQPGLYDANGALRIEAAPAGDAASITPIPLVVILRRNDEPFPDPHFDPPCHGDACGISLVESACDLGAMFGDDYRRSVTWALVERGPNYQRNKVRLYRDITCLPDPPFQQGGGYIELDAGTGAREYDLQAQLDFGGLTQAIEIMPPVRFWTCFVRWWQQFFSS